MRKWLFILLLLPLLITGAQAAELPEDLTGAVPEGAEDVLRDAGESAPAAVVETAGAVCALLTALPLLRAVLSLLWEFIA